MTYDNWKTRSPDDGHYDASVDEGEPQEESAAMAEFRTTPGGGLEILGPGGTWLSIPQPAADEIERLQEAKRRALNIADERSKENVELRAELERLRQSHD